MFPYQYCVSCSLYAAPYSLTFLDLLLIVTSSSYVMAFCSIHFEQVLIPGRLLVLRLSSVCCTVGKASWVFSASCSSRFSFNPSAVDILFTNLTKFSSFIYYLCYCLIGYLSEHILLDGSFDLWPETIATKVTNKYINNYSVIRILITNWKIPQ